VLSAVIITNMDPARFNFFIVIVGNGVQLGPLGSATTNKPDYDDVEKLVE
jgi:hypothetical protein